MTSKKVKEVRTGVFIDGSNLLWAMIRKDDKGDKINYDICFEKLKEFLKKNYSPVFYNYYVCEDNVATSEPYLSRSIKQKNFLKRLEGYGYSVKRKDLKVLKSGGAKCDTDVEIVLDLHKYKDDIDNIILFSGDSDFRGAVETFFNMGKHIRIYSFKSSLSWELKEFAIKNPRCNYKLLDELKDKLERIR
ncbi:MAG: hypothetical protein UY54_C0008G0006 [Parcubacteria group bacterium GW2011_GWA2_50_10b]|nr:MAG: hypothetical protein UY54_C0008G0006 [Parcubacteria group bacterium GW2011_GWA2_50_10b]